MRGNDNVIEKYLIFEFNQYPYRMKKLFCTIPFFCFIVFAQGQVVLKEFKIPAYGTVVKAKKNIFSGSVGAMGIGQVWDFSNEIYDDRIYSSYLTDPKNNEYGFNFPEANFCDENGVQSYNFRKVTATEQSVLGVYSSTSVGLIKYTDPLTAMKLPIKYPETQVDKFAANYSANGFNMSKSGTVKTIYDGFGTLITPYGTYKDVIRFKTTQIDIDSIADLPLAGQEFISSAFTTTSVTYSWYIPGHLNSLFAVIQLNLDGLDYGMQSILYDPSFLAATKDAYQKNMHVKIAPNPAKDVINIDFSEANEKFFEVTLLNGLGVEILKTKFSGFEKQVVQLPVSSFEKGSYLLKINSDETYRIEKIVIE